MLAGPIGTGHDTGSAPLAEHGDDLGDVPLFIQPASVVGADGDAQPAAATQPLVDGGHRAQSLDVLAGEHGHRADGRPVGLGDGLLHRLRRMCQPTQIYAIHGEIQRPQLSVCLQEETILVEGHLQQLGQRVVIARLDAGAQDEKIRLQGQRLTRHARHCRFDPQSPIHHFHTGLVLHVVREENHSRLASLLVV